MSEENPHFRRGALSVMCHAGDSRAVVMATYVEVPTEVSSLMSSGVCRYAVPIPLLDVNAALRHEGCAEAPVGQDLTRSQKQCLATLKFRIAVYLFNNMPMFHLAYSMTEETANSSPTKSIREVFKVVPLVQVNTCFSLVQILSILHSAEKVFALVQIPNQLRQFA